mmetsp:Transcript_93574/g.263997  ORF Transcript_93574/g.263997 Transcript_93574/m.263997 type:complete len:719 (+) Transcript_93574:74-2230(+)
MKALHPLSWAAAVAAFVAVPGSAEAAEDSVVTKVVKLLEKMQAKSEEEGDAERKVYAKFKCYCDSNEESKTKEIKSLTEDISMMEGKIEETQASSGLLSEEVVKLAADISANEEARKQAQALNDKEEESFEAKESDLKDAIEQMNLAITTLAEVGADQSMEAGADHAQFMAGGKGASLAKLKSSVKQALVAASAFVSKKRVQMVSSFIQDPFTGTYSARSGEVVGILKDMRDTFKANLEEARTEWGKAKEAHETFMKTALAEHTAMTEMYSGKQGVLGGNDQNLGALKGQLRDATETKADSEDFLSRLLDSCSEKKEQYDEREQLRAEEEAAISKAVAILGNDAAFATFEGTKANNGGPAVFLQSQAVQRHRPRRVLRHHRHSVKKAVAEEDFVANDLLGGRLAALLQAGTPFDVVLEEINKMVSVLEQEDKADIEQKLFCEKEIEEGKATITKKNGQIESLETEINELNTLIDDPKIGLVAQIKETEDDLGENAANQASETEMRQKENAVYQENVENLVKAEDLLKSAVNVLSKYYDKIAKKAEAAFVQVASKRTLSFLRKRAKPETWEGDYKGQSSDGNAALDMLEFLLSDTVKEEQEAHSSEAKAQKEFDESMASLKSDEAGLQESLSNLKETVARKEKELYDKHKDFEKTEEEKKAVKAYLEEIKPGCDFIADHFEKRQKARAKEIASLNTAAEKIQATPVYKEAVLAEHVEGR